MNIYQNIFLGICIMVLMWGTKAKEDHLVGKQQDNSLSEDEHNFNEIVKSLDKNHDGRLTVNDVKALLQELGYISTDDEIEATLKATDGMFDYTNFVNMKKSEKKLSDEELTNLFKFIDKDGDGYINKEDLKNTWISLGENKPESAIDEMMQTAVTDSSGRIGLEEFIKTMRSASSS